MALRGSEHASAMLDWVEQAGRAILALAMLFSIKKNKCFWSENNYRYTVKTDSDKKDL